MVIRGRGATNLILQLVFHKPLSRVSHHFGRIIGHPFFHTIQNLLPLSCITLTSNSLPQLVISTTSSSDEEQKSDEEQNKPMTQASHS